MKPKPKRFEAIEELVGDRLSLSGTSITEEEIDIKLAELIAAYPLQQLREKRNVLLASSDWTGLVDSALTNEKLAEWKMYRQHLRNLPDGLDTEDKVKEATWPVKPA